MNKVLLPILLIALTAGLTLPAGAVVPPRSCKTIEVKGKKHRVMADGVRCKFARRTARRFLRSGAEPARWNCTRKTSSPSMTFRCTRGNTRTVYGIKR